VTSSSGCDMHDGEGGPAPARRLCLELERIRDLHARGGGGPMPTRSLLLTANSTTSWRLARERSRGNDWQVRGGWRNRARQPPPALAALLCIVILLRLLSAVVELVATIPPRCPSPRLLFSLPFPPSARTNRSSCACPCHVGSRRAATSAGCGGNWGIFLRMPPSAPLRGNFRHLNLRILV
jgi:hypothetical protein